MIDVVEREVEQVYPECGDPKPNTQLQRSNFTVVSEVPRSYVKEWCRQTNNTDSIKQISGPTAFNATFPP
ncbi:hypothetical protein GCM10011585_34460 [Edaphobacter dinghuensis]|uniref:Uncharacterized protein n=1 Tax=Edaphobacter dinghuensis TaxID=1560005 RepID=A0A917HS92_9BACT|nr:hypothetical protein GCM10011585_34460 [Edaphobacter dinghuensis]